MKKFILYGFNKEKIEKIQNIIRFVNSKIKYITINESDFDKKLNEVILEEKLISSDEFSFDEQVIIFDGISSKEIDVYIRILKQKISKKIIFAMTTENSLNMKIVDLFDEFKQEKEYFKKK